jgi:hypothetical protein
MWWRASATEIATGDGDTPAFETPRTRPLAGTERPGARMRAPAASTPITGPRVGRVASRATSPTDRTNDRPNVRERTLARGRDSRFLANRFGPSNMAKVAATVWVRTLAPPREGADAARRSEHSHSGAAAFSWTLRSSAWAVGS